MYSCCSVLEPGLEDFRKSTDIFQELCYQPSKNAISLQTTNLKRILKTSIVVLIAAEVHVSDC